MIPRRCEMFRKEENKERKVKKIIKEKKDLKPFQIRHYRFFPCCWAASLKEKYVYYLINRKQNAYIITHELNSPRFKSREEAVAFVSNNKDYSFIPA